MGLIRSRTASKVMRVAVGTRFWASGLIKGLRGLVGLESRLGNHEPFAEFGAGLATGSGSTFESGTCGAAGWVLVAATETPG